MRTFHTDTKVVCAYIILAMAVMQFR